MRGVVSRAETGLSFAKHGFAAHLHVRSGFSYGQGVAYPEELASAAAGLGYESLALTDRDGVYGLPKFLAACAEHGLSPIVGAEITVEARFAGTSNRGERGHLVLLCESMEGYAALSRLITRSGVLERSRRRMAHTHR